MLTIKASELHSPCCENGLMKYPKRGKKNRKYCSICKVTYWIEDDNDVQGIFVEDLPKKRRKKIDCSIVGDENSLQIVRNPQNSIEASVGDVVGFDQQLALKSILSQFSSWLPSIVL